MTWIFVGMEEVRLAIRHIRKIRESRLERITCEEKIEKHPTQKKKSESHDPSKKKTLKIKKSVDEVAVFERFHSLRNVLLEQYTRSRFFEEAMVTYTPPVIEAYTDKEYTKMMFAAEEEKKPFSYEKVEEIQRETKFMDKFLPGRIASHGMHIKLQHWDDYAIWKMVTPGGQLLAFIAYEIA